MTVNASERQSTAFHGRTMHPGGTVDCGLTSVRGSPIVGTQLFQHRGETPLMRISN